MTPRAFRRMIHPTPRRSEASGGPTMNKGARIPARAAVAMVALAAIALALPQAADATCINPLPMQHSLGSYFTNCYDARPVEGYLYVLGQDATLNSNSKTPAAGADEKI